jgi:hypothetical protein
MRQEQDLFSDRIVSGHLLFPALSILHHLAKKR